MILGVSLIISMMLLNIKITSNEFFSTSISLKRCTALACDENLEGMGTILLMKICHWEENYMDGEYWIHKDHWGCEDDNSSCSL